MRADDTRRRLAVGTRELEVVAVNTIPLFGRTPPTGWARGTDPNENLHTLVRVETDGGVEGWGSCYTNRSLVDGALEVLAPLLLGENALEPERVSEKLHEMTYWQGRGGAITHAISGIDIALWDILGKATGQPIGRLLGGIYRTRIRAYASLLFADPPVLQQLLEQAVASGFKAVKLGWVSFGRIDAKHDELLVKTARQTVGPNVELMVDAGGFEEFWPHGYKWALETSRMLREYDVVWFEEPLRPDDIEGLVRLTQYAPLPIAGGEVLTGRQNFRSYIEKHCVDIIQPDTTKCGGLSEARRIGWMARDHGVLLVSHGWNTALGLAADLHLAAAMPVARWVEFQMASPYVDEIATTAFELDANGCLGIPSSPGLGIELDMEAIEGLSRLES